MAVLYLSESRILSPTLQVRIGDGTTGFIFVMISLNCYSSGNVKLSTLRFY